MGISRWVDNLLVVISTAFYCIIVNSKQITAEYPYMVSN